ncbi:MAG: hypothetical protein AMXMBFR7_43480 [Planctomycetota bacterium]
MLGHEHRDLVVQSDKEAAKTIRKKIYDLAQESLKFETTGDRSIAILGLKAWPFPIPMLRQQGNWAFDTAAGKEEILNRRIGRNELRAIDFMRAYPEAQLRYAAVDRDGDKVLKYAKRLISSNGAQDGLYWPTVAGVQAEPSPLAPMIVDDGAFLDGDGTNIPYHGYYFKVLTRQGSHPPNGKYDYVINGNMIAGFALVGWPADYGTSGIMTFVVSHHGLVYQKDLGRETEKVARKMDRYDPDANWAEVESERE